LNSPADTNSRIPVTNSQLSPFHSLQESSFQPHPALESTRVIFSSLHFSSSLTVAYPEDLHVAPPMIQVSDNMPAQALMDSDILSSLHTASSSSSSHLVNSNIHPMTVADLWSDAFYGPTLTTSYVSAGSAPAVNNFAISSSLASQFIDDSRIVTSSGAS
jgi:hypothetical protein